jgi:hypothetical protein
MRLTMRVRLLLGRLTSCDGEFVDQPVPTRVNSRRSRTHLATADVGPFSDMHETEIAKMFCQQTSPPEKCRRLGRQTGWAL